ncbi:MAG TPA: NADH dehydrogenase (quinone) subunit D [Acidobacteriota bacterium]|nr:NADH dehydrogenase (quinone) subunit D [Acidobacteriota bacterium]
MATEQKIAEDTGHRIENMWLNFGPQHPSAHGTLHLVIEVDGERIVSSIPHIGYLHCGFEKLGEHRSYNQFTAIADRMNYLSPMCNDIGWSMACEKLFDVEITERCALIRMIVMELSRIADHMFATGMQAVDIGAFTWFLYGWRHREEIYDILERCCGQRLTTSYSRIGGLMRDMDDTAVAMAMDTARRLPKTLDDMDGLLKRNRIWVDRTSDVGSFSAEQALNWGYTGPCLRAAGVPYDVRKDDPYLLYDQVDFDIPIGEHGDVFDRWNVRMEEMRQSARIVEQCCQMLKPGPINTPDNRFHLPPRERLYDNIESMIMHFKQVMFGHGTRPPKGEIYCRTEAPNGELGFYIVSDGTDNPYRIHVRSPSLIQFSAIPEQINGGMISDLVAIMGSLNIIAGELDR